MITRIYSVASLFSPGCSLSQARPFMALHYTISRAGLIGGGTPARADSFAPAHLAEALQYRARS